MLEKPEWKNDIWPEFMDGKNVFDYVDPDILKKLERLEKEEEEYSRSQADRMDDDGDESSELSEDLLEANEDVEKNKKVIRKKHELTKNSQLPRRVRGITESEKFMQEIRSEKKEMYNNLEGLAKKETTGRREKLRSSLKKEAKKAHSDDEYDSDSGEDAEDNGMDIDEENNKTTANKKRRRNKMTQEEEFKAQQRGKIEAQRKVTIQRMKNKIQKNWNRAARVNDADRQIASKLPKHLNSGKRGIGKTERR
jgi:nucleolar GTP-binding protein